MTRDDLEIALQDYYLSDKDRPSIRKIILAEFDRLNALNAQLLDALKAFMECPERLDEATVPKRFIGHIEDAPPYQVVVNWSVAYTKILNARAAIAAAEEAR